jgi:hypothetical protein
MRTQPLYLIFMQLAIIVSLNAADWKYVGVSHVEGHVCFAFYDASTRETSQGGLVSVWLKFLDSAQVVTALQNFTPEMVELTTAKIAHSYIPPYSRAMADTTLATRISVTQLEIIANKMKSPPRLLIRDEIDLKRRLVRTLSAISYDAQGQSSSSASEKGEWSDIAPESFAEFLMKLIRAKQ